MYQPTPEEIQRVNRAVRTLTRRALVEQCQQQNLPVHGTKYDLAQRLHYSHRPSNIVQCLRQERKTIVMHKTNDGRFYHEGSRIVFDPEIQKAIGYLDEDGVLQSLDRKHIDLCYLFKFQYVLPENLDEKAYEGIDTHTLRYRGTEEGVDFEHFEDLV